MRGGIQPFPAFPAVAADSGTAGTDLAAPGETETIEPFFRKLHLETPVEPVCRRVPQFHVEFDIVPVYGNNLDVSRRNFVGNHETVPFLVRLLHRGVIVPNLRLQFVRQKQISPCNRQRKCQNRSHTLLCQRHKNSFTIKSCRCSESQRMIRLSFRMRGAAASLFRLLLFRCASRQYPATCYISPSIGGQPYFSRTRAIMARSGGENGRAGFTRKPVSTSQPVSNGGTAIPGGRLPR